MQTEMKLEKGSLDFKEQVAEPTIGLYGRLD